MNDEARVCFLKMHNLVMEVYESEDAAGKIGAIEHVAIDVTDIEQVYKEICDKNMNTLQDFHSGIMVSVSSRSKDRMKRK